MRYRKKKVLPFDVSGCSGTRRAAALTRLHSPATGLLCKNKLLNFSSLHLETILLAPKLTREKSCKMYWFIPCRLVALHGSLDFLSGCSLEIVLLSPCTQQVIQ